MTNVGAQVVDWRTQFTALDPHLKGLGGVIQVRVGSDSPSSAFARALRHKMSKEQWPFPWTSVQIDRSNASTHYVSDIIGQILKSIGRVAETTRQSPVSIGIGQGIKARAGNVNIHDIEVSITQDEPAVNKINADIRRLCEILPDYLKTRRLALLIMNSHEYSRSEIALIRRTMWDDALEGLIDHGLLVLDFSNTALIPDVSIWPPDPLLAIELPAKYDDYSRQAAREDLSEIALEAGLVTTPDQAAGFAEALLMTSHNIRDMYAGLALCVLAPGTANGS